MTDRCYGLLKVATGIACGWEAAALVSQGRLPTLSVLCGRYRWVRPIIIAGLAAHLYPRRKATSL